MTKIFRLHITKFIVFRLLVKVDEKLDNLCKTMLPKIERNSISVIITDGNAASEYTAFWPSSYGLDYIDGQTVFSEYWTHENQIEAWKRKRMRCAEVLVPDRIDPKYILGVYVSCENAKRKIEKMEVALEITIDAHLFFLDKEV